MSPEPNPEELLSACLSAAPAERIAMLERAGADDDLFVALGDEAERLAFADISKALLAAELVVQLADQQAGARPRARARRALAQALAYAGRHDESLAACHAAIDVAGDEALVEAGRARVASLHPLNELGRYGDALTAGEEAHQILTAAGEPALAARADLNLGGIHQNRSEPKRALFHFDRAAPALVGEPLMTGYLQNNRGEALLLLNDFDGAEACFHAAMVAADEGGAAVVAAIAQGNIADLETRRGRLSQALYHFEHARRRLENDVAQSHVARLLGEEAEALESLGMPDDACATYESALAALDHLGMAAECARTRAGLGRVLLRLGRTEEADRMLREAGDGYHALGQQAAAARVALVRSEAALALGHHAVATELIGESTRVLDADPLDRIALLIQVASLRREQGDLTGAIEALTNALQRARAFDIAPLCADVLHRRGLCHRNTGERDRALEDMEAAAAQRERVRGALQAERYRSAVTAGAADLYEDLLAAHLDKDEPDVATLFRAVELAKSRTLLDRVAARTDQVAPTSEKLVARRDQLRGKLSALCSRLADAHHAGRQVLDLAAWQAQIRERQQELEEVEQRLATAASLDITRPGPTTLDEVCESLAPDTAVVEFFGCSGKVHALVLTTNRQWLVRELAPLPDVERHLESLQFQLQRAARPGAVEGRRGARLLADARAELAWFHDRLVAPWRPAIAGAERLTIIPHGPLHALPIQAAWNGEQYLIEQFSVHFAPSASVLRVLKAQAATRAGQGALAIGVADEIATEVECEAREMTEVLGGECLTGAEATVAKVLRRMPGKRYLHFACHGYFDPDHPGTGGLRMHDRWLGGHDFADLALAAELVTLSGCHTGRHALRAGEELVGLARGFLASGAANVLVTLWAAHDEKTRRLMGDFYTMLSGNQAPGGDLGAALAAATRTFMQQEPHPCFWAPFILMGRS